MRARTRPYTPDPSSLTYPCGRLTVRLLGGDGTGYLHLIRRLSEAMGESPTRAMDAANGAMACYAYALWDDPDIECICDYDPDEVLLAEGPRLIEIATRLRMELFGPGAKRLGLDLQAFGAKVLPRAVWGLAPEGEAEPAPTLEPSPA